MNIDNAIEKLKTYNRGIYHSTYQKMGPNIYRGHLRSMSTHIEDGIALFVADILPSDYKFFIDPSIRLCGKNNRPDLLIVDENENVTAMVEIKANIGWCRDTSEVVNHIVNIDSQMKTQKDLKCIYSNKEYRMLHYGKDVKLFLAVFSGENGSGKFSESNKVYASDHSVYQFILFSGWYEALTNGEVEEFGRELLR